MRQMRFGLKKNLNVDCGIVDCSIVDCQSWTIDCQISIVESYQPSREEACSSVRACSCLCLFFVYRQFLFKQPNPKLSYTLVKVNLDLLALMSQSGFLR